MHGAVLGGMGLLLRALRAARSCRAIALPAFSYEEVSGRGGAAAVRPQQPRRGLSARPRLDELFAIPSLSRLLKARVQGEARPELAARIQRLRDKERELQDTRELALQDESEDLRKLAEREIVSCEEEIAELKHQKKQTTVILSWK